MSLLSVVRSFIVLSLGLAVVSARADADVFERIKERGSFIYGADAAGGAPFVFPDPVEGDKVMRGFEVELADMFAQALTQKLGAPIKATLQQGDWDTLPGLVDRGTIDMALNGFELTSTRARDYRVSRPYYLYGLQLVARREGPVNSWDDLMPHAGRKAVKVGVLGSSQADAYLRNANQEHDGFNVEVVPYNGNSEAMDQLEQGLLDAVLQDDCIAPYYFTETDRYPHLKLVGLPVRPGFYVALFKRDADGEALGKFFDETLETLIKEHKLRDLYTKWRLAGSIQELSLPHDYVMEAARHEALWNLVKLHLPSLLKAAAMTVFLSLVSMPLAIAIGILVAIGRLYCPWWVARPLTFYVEILRGTPLMLQLYAIFFLLPKIGILVPPLVAAIAGLAINYSAYEAEIYRAGLQAIPRGQMEAALSLGMTRFQAIWRIILPQAFRIVIPPVTNDFIALFKDTSVCSVVTVMELTKQYSVLALSTGRVIEMATLTAILYMLMSYPLSVFAAWNERRLQGHAVGHHH